MGKGYRVELTTLAREQILQIAHYIKDDLQVPETAEKFVDYAKAATYGKAHWLRFDRFWDTGEEERGGLVIVRENQAV